MKGTPSFRGLRPTSEAASRVGRGNRKWGTRPELLLCRALRKQGLWYRLHDARLPGRPDVVLVGPRIAIFCDGNFWHGHSWAKRRARLAKGANASYWVAKIERNVDRDRRIRQKLRKDGWFVVRVWESDVIKDPEGTGRRIVALARKKTREIVTPAERCKPTKTR